MKLSVKEDVFPIAGAFTISRGTRTESRVVTVELERDGIRGWAECYPYARYDETVESVIAQIEAMAPSLAVGSRRVSAMPRSAIASSVKRASSPKWWRPVGPRERSSRCAISSTPPRHGSSS